MLSLQGLTSTKGFWQTLVLCCDSVPVMTPSLCKAWRAELGAAEP